MNMTTQQDTKTRPKHWLPPFSELEQWERPALMTLSEKIKMGITEMKNKIAHAIEIEAAEGKMPDPRWFYRLRRALGIYQRYDQTVQRLIGQKRPAVPTIPYYFVDIARQTLPETQFQNMIELARSRQKLDLTTPEHTLQDTTPASHTQEVLI